MTKNRQSVVFYALLIKIHNLFVSKVIPMAGHLGLEKEDGAFFTALEDFGRELERHLDSASFQVTLKKTGDKISADEENNG